MCDSAVILDKCTKFKILERLLKGGGKAGRVYYYSIVFAI